MIVNAVPAAKLPLGVTDSVLPPRLTVPATLSGLDAIGVSPTVAWYVEPVPKLTLPVFVSPGPPPPDVRLPAVMFTGPTVEPLNPTALAAPLMSRVPGIVPPLIMRPDPL